MLTTRQKVARATSRTSKISVSVVTTNVREIMQEVKSGKWSDETVLSPMLTVGQCKSTPEFDRNPEVVNEIAAAFLGRLCRAICVEEGIDFSSLSMPQLVKILQPTDRIQEAAVKQIITIH